MVFDHFEPIVNVSFFDAWYSSLPMENEIFDDILPISFTELWIPFELAQRAINLLKKPLRHQERLGIRQQRHGDLAHHMTRQLCASTGSGLTRTPKAPRASTTSSSGTCLRRSITGVIGESTCRAITLGATR
ncbi:hypothetical protein BC938DRAFT_484048 [Jimgerdemannia flammicorona]|uniref:Uncharacterized protein n=1 Tax=Jimgerdemannia flammicorona TaxID=994334 RepID=A0A433QAP9_9FUNG|nr:hypothetical protein BC938DRAFT_484048 [Jimgerdemannia flammicorona]